MFSRLEEEERRWKRRTTAVQQQLGRAREPAWSHLPSLRPPVSLRPAINPTNLRGSTALRQTGATSHFLPLRTKLSAYLLLIIFWYKKTGIPVNPFFLLFFLQALKKGVHLLRPENPETRARRVVFIGEVVMAMGAQTMLLNDAVTKGKQECRNENDPYLSRKRRSRWTFPPPCLFLPAERSEVESLDLLCLESGSP